MSTRKTLSFGDFAHKRLIEPYHGNNLSNYIEHLALLGWEMELNEDGNRLQQIANVQAKNQELSQIINELKKKLAIAIDERDDFKKKYNTKNEVVETEWQVGGSRVGF